MAPSAKVRRGTVRIGARPPMAPPQCRRTVRIGLVPLVAPPRCRGTEE